MGFPGDLKLPIIAPKSTIVVLLMAVYLLCQSAVTWHALRDGCRGDARWASFLTAINWLLSLLLIGYVCYVIARRPESSAEASGMFT